VDIAASPFGSSPHDSKEDSRGSYDLLSIAGETILAVDGIYCVLSITDCIQYAHRERQEIPPENSKDQAESMPR
jgi:hypothetical protein